MLTVLGKIGQGFGAGSAPDAPTLSVVNDGTGTSFTATVAGDGAINLYYRIAGESGWTAGGSRAGNGTIQQVLLARNWYDVYATNTVGGVVSAPSVMRTVHLSDSVEVNTPVIEYIAANIETTINAITTGNGYSQTLIAGRVNAEDFASVSPENGKVLIVQTDEDLPERQAPLSRDTFQTFILVAFVIVSEDAAGSIDTLRNRVKADITKAMMAVPTRGNYAIDTEIFETDFFKDDQGITGLAIPMRVRYRTKHDDPYTKL
jgi:hypothetical protein